MKKRILILGGTGFIGYHLARKSLKKNFFITSVSKNKPIKKRYLKKVNYIIGDISKKKFIKRILKENFDYIVNLAGYVDHSKKKEVYQSHYIGCKNIVNSLLKKKIKSFIQIGSSMEYGLTKSPHQEHFKCKPLSFYGKAKFLSTKYLIDLYAKKKTPVTILRLYQIYGPNQDLNRFLPIVINACKFDLDFPCSHGKQYRDFLYIDDLIEAIFLTFKSSKARGQIINIGYGTPLKIKNIINKIINFYKSGKPKFNKIKLRKEERLKIYPDLSKAKKLINWTPKTNFLKGLKKTINYYNAN